MRAVLVTISDAANRDGSHAHPGMEAMVEGSLYSRAHVSATVRKLIAERWLEVEEVGGGRGMATVFRVLMDRSETAQPLARNDDTKPPTLEGETAQSEDPSPIGSTVSTTGASDDAARRADPNYRFDEFWTRYPPRKGRREEKQKAREQWRKLSFDDKAVAFKAAKVFAESRPELPKDAFRWLRDRSFEDWIESAAPGSTAAPIRYGQLSDDERMRLDQGRRYRDRVLRQIAAGDDSEYDPGPDPGDEAYWAEWERTGVLP